MAAARARRALASFLTAPVDIASLAAFRALFGVVMCIAALRTLAKGWVGQLYLAPAFHFTYPPARVSPATAAIARRPRPR